MVWRLKIICCGLGLLLAGYAALPSGCGPVVLAIETDTRESAKPDTLRARVDQGEGPRR